MRIAPLLLALSLVACEPAPASPDAAACGMGTISYARSVGGSSGMSMVVVVDGVGDAGGDEYATRLEAGLRVLATGDRDGDGRPDLRTELPLHVLVVSASIGDECGPAGAAITCGAAPWTTLDDGTDLDAALAEIGCAVRVAADASCGMNRPIDAASLALLPSSRGGRGDTEHAGFVRTRHVPIAVAWLASRDDVSRVEPADAAGALVALRENPALLRLSALGGYPELARGAAELAALASVAPSDVPVCTSASLAPTPAPRLAALLEAAAVRGADAQASPLCELGLDWLVPFVTTYAEPFTSSACFPRALPRDAAGLVDCVLEITLPPPSDRVRFADCAALGARSLGPSPTDPDRERCAVTQLGSRADLGEALAFTYDDGPEAADRCRGWWLPGQELVLSDVVSRLDTESHLSVDCHYVADLADAGRARCE